jgi:pilus assembly protein Flp/PilA
LRAIWDKIMVKYLMWKTDEEGQTLVEYALLLALIAVVVIVILTTLGQNVRNTFSTVSSAVGSAS